MLKSVRFLFVLVTVAAARGAGNDDAQICNQEKAYWEYVKANDMEKYRSLWHADFVGWPASSAEPAHKGEKEKMAIAPRVRQHTSVDFNWIAQRLKMGSAGYVSNLLRKV